MERRNPFPHVLDATPIPDTAAEVDLSRLDVGDNEYGGPFLLNLRGKRLLVVGASGSGKSSLLWNPLRAAGPAVITTPVTAAQRVCDDDIDKIFWETKAAA